MLYKELSTVKTFAAPSTKSKLPLPEPTVDHFFTTGRMLSWFPQVNKNGFCFLKDDVSPELAKTLLNSTVDLEHLKLGYDEKSQHIGGSNNTTCGAVSDVMYHDDGIDITCKMERIVAKALGFDPESFAPGGYLGSYSQESSYSPYSGKYIVVDKSDPTKILHSFSYADGQALNLDLSHVGADGKWHYSLYEGNPTYFAVKPASFSGVGHVVNPADPSGIVYKLAASNNGVNPGNDQLGDMEFTASLNPSDKFRTEHGVKGSDGNYHLPLPPKGHPEAKKYARAVLTRAHQVTKLSPDQVEKQVQKAKDILGESAKSTSGYYGMDPPGNYPGQDMTGLYGDVQPGSGPNTQTDMNIWAADLTSNPDILTCNIDKHLKADPKDAEDKSIPDDHFASCYSDMDYSSDRNGVLVKNRALRIKNDKGELDRGKLISAYHQLMGTRGDFQKMRDMPRGPKIHAMAMVRQGLKSTQPIKKVISSMNEQEIEALKAKLVELQETQLKSVSKADYEAAVAAKTALEAQIEEYKTQVQTLTASLEVEKAAIKEVNDKALASARYSELEKVLPFEVKAEEVDAHETYKKSLASLSPEQFSIEVLRRQNQVLSKSLASVRPGMPLVNPVPSPDGNTQPEASRFRY